jgi:tetratricopeptide (TPR) repeat protein
MMWRGEYDDAIERYRQVLKQDSKNVMAVNNLAVLLAVVKKNHAEAQSLINQLIDTAGMSPVLLDSRAMIWLAADRADDARMDLEQSIKDAPSADNHFHLAQALVGLKQEPAAREAFAKALKLGLAEDRLQPFERDEFRRLKSILQ